MKNIERRFLAAILILYYHLAVQAKVRDKLLTSQNEDTSSFFHRRVHNNYIHEVVEDREKTKDLNGRDFQVIRKKDELKISLTNVPAIRTDPNIFNGAQKRKAVDREQAKKTPSESTHRRLQITPKSVQSTQGSPQTTQRSPPQTTHRSLRGCEKTVQKSKFTNSTLSESNFANTLSSKISLRTLPNDFFYHTFEPREMNENYASSNGVELQAKRSFLLPTILNALRKALDIHPFKTWKLKHKFCSMKDIRIHENELYAVTYNGWNERLKHKLYKVMQGENVYLDVFGGSNTVGAGLKKEEGDLEGRYSKVITDWWDKVITPLTGSHLKLRQIAMGGTSSEFFQFCFTSYIHKQLDLVFIEMAVNDVRDLPKNANRSLPLEQFTRQLLAYPTEPALVYINLFKGRTCNVTCANLEDYGLGILSNTYNITSLSWRDAVCSEKARNNLKDHCDLICSDGLHINQLGHAHISLMVINLFRRILLEHISSVIKNSRVSRVKKSTRASFEKKSTRVSRRTIFSLRDQVPRGISRQKLALPSPVFIKKASNIISDPLCWTRLSPNHHFKNALKSNLDIVVTRTNGFYLETTKLGGGKCKTPPCRADAYSSWTGRVVGANMTLSFTVPGGNSSAEGNKTRSVAIAARTFLSFGAADMWLDTDYKNKKFVNTKLTWGRTIVPILALRVKPGRHSVNVEIVRKGEVSVVAIMIGPPDGPY